MKALKKLCLFIAAFFAFTAAPACNLSSFKDSESVTSHENESLTPESGESTTPETSETPDSESSESSEDLEDPEAALAEEIMDMAYALGYGEELDGVYTLSGTVTEITNKYSSSKGVTLIMQVHEPQNRSMMCYQLKGDGASLISVGYTIKVTGSIQNYQGQVEFDKGCYLLSYEYGSSGGEDLPDVNNDPYANMTSYKFYQNYTPATSNEDAYYRSLHGFMSGELETPDQAPALSSYQPSRNGQLIRNSEMQFSEDGKAYTVVDAYGAPAFTVYRDGAYITLEEVAAYVYAFGTVPKNYDSNKKADPDESIWGEYLRVNHTAFSGSTSKYPYEPELPNISGCGGSLNYYEIDIGTTGTDCDPSYDITIYNDGSTITRGAARIVYGKNDLDKDGVYELNEHHVFYTYNHYNDFQEYLNYEGGWGEIFGNITGGGSLSSKNDYAPTNYVQIFLEELPVARYCAFATVHANEAWQYFQAV